MEISQNLEDLIYNISLFKTSGYGSIPYEEGGIYERIVKNFKENNKNEQLAENEEYGWYRVRSTYFINLVKPDIKPESLGFNSKFFSGVYDYNSNDQLVFYKKPKGVIYINKYLYRSAKKDNCFGVTFGDSRRILQPFKILEHQWSGVLNGKVLPKTQKVCKKCEAISSGNYNEGDNNHPFPDLLLNCDEYIMHNIII